MKKLLTILPFVATLTMLWASNPLSAQTIIWQKVYTDMQYGNIWDVVQFSPDRYAVLYVSPAIGSSGLTRVFCIDSTGNRLWLNSDVATSTRIGNGIRIVANSDGVDVYSIYGDQLPGNGFKFVPCKKSYTQEGVVLDSLCSPQVDTYAITGESLTNRMLIMGSGDVITYGNGIKWDTVSVADASWVKQSCIQRFKGNDLQGMSFRHYRVDTLYHTPGRTSMMCEYPPGKLCEIGFIIRSLKQDTVKCFTRFTDANGEHIKTVFRQDTLFYPDFLYPAKDVTLYASGVTISKGNSLGIVTRYDTNGNVLARRNFGRQRMLCMTSDNKGGYILGGLRRITDTSSTWLLMGIDASLNTTWQMTGTKPGYIDQVSRIIPTGKGTFLAIGLQGEDNAVRPYAMEFNPEGVSSVEAIENPSALRLSPNPVSGSLLTIQATDKDISIRSLYIADLLGRQLKWSSDVYAGSSAVIDVNGLSNGQYFLRAETNRGYQTLPFTIE